MVSLIISEDSGRVFKSYYEKVFFYFFCTTTSHLTLSPKSVII